MNKLKSAPPRPIDLLISGGFIYTADAHNTTYYPGSVAIDNGVIISVGLSSETDLQFNPNDHIDAGGQAVMPGLINLHCHASNSLIRGIGRDLPLNQWLNRVCWPCMNNADPYDLLNGVMLSCLEMLENGITTFADMWKGVDITSQAVKESGQRAFIAYNIKDFGDRKRGERELQSALDSCQKWNGAVDGRVTVGLGPHSVYTCQPTLLSLCAAKAAEHGLHVQTHASETLQEIKQCQKQHGASPIEIMDDAGLLTPNTIVAHGVHVDDHDIQIMNKRGVSLAHNIASNLILGSGIAPIPKYISQGICVGLGTDGPGSNDSLDLLKDLKLATLTQKGKSLDTMSLTVIQALSMVTKSGAQALGEQVLLGSLEAGKRADIILINYDRPHLTPKHFDNKKNILSNLVYVATGADVETVLVNGQVLVAEGKAINLNRQEIQSKAQESSKKVIKYSKL